MFWGLESQFWLVFCVWSTLWVQTSYSFEKTIKFTHIWSKNMQIWCPKWEESIVFWTQLNSGVDIFLIQFLNLCFLLPTPRHNLLIWPGSWTQMNIWSLIRSLLLFIINIRDKKPKNYKNVPIRTISIFRRDIYIYYCKKVKDCQLGRISGSVLVSPWQCVIILCNLCVWSMLIIVLYLFP